MGVRRQSRRWQRSSTWFTSTVGVIFLKRVLTISRQVGMYLSKRTTRFDFSDGIALVSSQLVTNLRDRGRWCWSVVSRVIMLAD